MTMPMNLFAKNDSIQKDALFETLIQYDFNLCRGKQSITEYLHNNFKKYVQDLSLALENSNDSLDIETVKYVKKNILYLEQICDETIRIIKTANQGQTIDAHRLAYELFEKLKNNLAWSEVYRKEWDGYYRIRPKKIGKNEKTSLFHIPYNQQNLIRAYRYSIAGQPCLYASSDIRLAWIECDMPHEFSYVQLKIDEFDDGQPSLQLIDFSRNIKLIYGSAKNNNQFPQSLINYIMVYPLRAACSLKVQERKDPYIVEYIIPQLLMKWIRDNERFDGIKYKSSVYNSLVFDEPVYNIALTTSRYREDGLDIKLTDKIQVSYVEFVDLKKEFERYKSTLKLIEHLTWEFRNKIAKLRYKDKDLEYLADLCDMTVFLFSSLQQDKYSNTELVFRIIDLIGKTKAVVLSYLILKQEEMKQKYGKKKADEIVFDLEYFQEYLGRLLDNKELFFAHIKKQMRSFSHI